MNSELLIGLSNFLVKAKAATYAGSGAETDPSREGSHDLKYEAGEFIYLDSYFGGSDFIGQEVVYYQGNPFWAMNYYGRILMPDNITGEEAGKIIKESLSALYQEGRFLGGFEYSAGDSTYIDTNQGDVDAFAGKEWILRDSLMVYELHYHGGMIRD